MANIENTASRSLALIVNKADGSAGLIVSTYVVCERLSVVKKFQESGITKFVLKSLRTPYSEIWYRTLPPPKLKFGQILLFWVLTTTEHPSPWKLKFGQILTLWVLTTTEHLPPLPNWNLGRSCHFEFWLLQNTPLKIEIWADLGTLSFDYHRTPAPLYRNWNLGRSGHFEFWLPQNTPPNIQLEYVETNRCIPKDTIYFRTLDEDAPILTFNSGGFPFLCNSQTSIIFFRFLGKVNFGWQPIELDKCLQPCFFWTKSFIFFNSPLKETSSFSACTDINDFWIESPA